MPTIATLTLNPTIDTGFEVERVFPTHKMRTIKERYDPGGGGINVSRVFARLGGTAHSYYLSGGPTGIALDELLAQHTLACTRIKIAGTTRISASLYDRESQQEYRVVPAGPTIAPAEWQACIDALDHAECDYLVVSGSLAPGIPDDFYARVAARAVARGIKIVLDSSGAGLREGLACGHLHLVKPSLGELRQLAGKPLANDTEIADAALHLVTSGQTEMVAVTMGHEGALLATRNGTVRLPALPVTAVSTVGAGDCFVAGMVFALATGKQPPEAFRYGIAAGSAAVMTPGSDLAHPEDIERLLPQVGAA